MQSTFFFHNIFPYFIWWLSIQGLNNNLYVFRCKYLLFFSGFYMHCYWRHGVFPVDLYKYNDLHSNSRRTTNKKKELNEKFRENMGGTHKHKFYRDSILDCNNKRLVNLYSKMWKCIDFLGLLVFLLLFWWFLFLFFFFFWFLIGLFLVYVLHCWYYYHLLFIFMFIFFIGKYWFWFQYTINKW